MTTKKKTFKSDQPIKDDVSPPHNGGLGGLDLDALLENPFAGVKVKATRLPPAKPTPARPVSPNTSVQTPKQPKKRR